MSKPHILHVVGSTDRSGAGVAASVCELCSALADLADITILAGHGRGELYPVDARVRRILCPSRRLAGLRLSLATGFRQQLETALDAGVDVVHVHGLWMAEVHMACAVARRRKIPYVVSAHGMLMPWAFRHKRWKKFLPWLCYQRADLRQAVAVIANSEPEAVAIRAFRFPNTTPTVPHGIHVPPWEPPRNGVPPRQVIFLGRLHPIKGLMNLMDAWAVVRPKDWQLILAGPDEGGFQSALTERIRQHNMSNTVTFIGPLDDARKWDLLRQADLVVLPSFTENFGLVVLEALACGVPVITTKGTPWAVLEGGVDGGGSWVEGGQRTEDGRRRTVNGERLSVSGEQFSVKSEKAPCHLPPTTNPSPLATPATAHCPLPTAHSSPSRCGWWVEIGVSPLAAALREAMDLTDADRRQMGQRGYELASASFAWERVARAMMGNYDRLKGFRLKAEGFES